MDPDTIPKSCRLTLLQERFVALYVANPAAGASKAAVGARPTHQTVPERIGEALTYVASGRKQIRYFVFLPGGMLVGFPRPTIESMLAPRNLAKRH